MLQSLRHAQKRSAVRSQVWAAPFDVYEFGEDVVHFDRDVAEEREEEKDQREGDEGAAWTFVVAELGWADDEERDGDEGEYAR